MTLKFQRVTANEMNFAELDKFADRSVQQTLPWVNFIAQTHGAAPVFLVLFQGSDILGYFTGLIIRKFGIRILGSPFAGWNTRYMGFNLAPGVSRKTAAQALWDFAFTTLECGHVEFMDRNMSLEDCRDLECQKTIYLSHAINLTEDEDGLLRNMKRQCRQNIRKAKRCGVYIEEAEDLEFADEYYSQRTEVFRKNGVFSPLGVDRVKRLIALLRPTGNLLLLRAKNKHGICIATGIYVGMNDFALAWGQASRTDMRDVRPNDALIWYAMKHWKNKGLKSFDLLGRNAWKEKFGSEPIEVPWIRKSKTPGIEALRNCAEYVYSRAFTLVARLTQSKCGANSPQTATHTPGKVV
jgi:hypothetical protein